MKYITKVLISMLFFLTPMVSTPAFASICPSTSGLGPYGGGNVGTATTCNMVITFNSNGGISTTFGPQTNYDGIEDALIGVVNNSGHAITSIDLSGRGIFSFDGDGVDGYTGITNAAAGLSSQPFYNYVGSQLAVDQYGGADAYFTNVVIGLGYLGQNSSGTVNFLNGISGSGGQDYFALEKSISINAPPQITGTNLSATPEPSTLALFGTGILLMGVMAYRRKKAAA